ncbi:type I-E CRISPR-associated protein Cas5/CasD [Corynebacterium mendelii]|uniref:Type I-E CRISPR-associated protein Cas5/CasD n=1 Tax=Corynebacterium mendelii TaxID=2765362 RepID=A0A939DZS7_9CORY|nr:type I-E CRISPR-associated protein Cas5/CasD [Corynebacterium mendelii]MBN9644275.1 type I-E CRISPR-associated protein Cas5/CasD [Corynebacterium mendelii]
MTSTLVLRLAAPLQSWGTDSRANRRETRREPSKSGVIGMLAAASGRLRTDDVSDLAQLKFGTRIDQPGVLQADFQTARDWVTGKNKALSYRDYLMDAVFLVALEGQEDLIDRCAEALQRPVYPYFLGRRSCPPTRRVVLRTTSDSLEECLSSEDWLASEHHRRKQPEKVRLSVVRDAAPGETPDEMVVDTPASFHPTKRVHDFRAVVRSSVMIENPVAQKKYRGHAFNDDHDPMAFLERR